MIFQDFINPRQAVLDQFISPYNNAGVNSNLKELNTVLQPPHLKLKDYSTALRLSAPGHFMATLDLKSVHHQLIWVGRPSDRKYLGSEFERNLYEFITSLLGFAQHLHEITKLFNPGLHILHSAGYTD